MRNTPKAITANVRCIICNQVETLAPADIPHWLHVHHCIHTVEDLIQTRRISEMMNS